MISVSTEDKMDHLMVHVKRELSSRCHSDRASPLHGMANSKASAAVAAFDPSNFAVFIHRPSDVDVATADQADRPRVLHLVSVVIAARIRRSERYLRFLLARDTIGWRRRNLTKPLFVQGCLHIADETS